MREKESKIEKPYLSQSQILTYARCPEHYLFRYVLGIKIPPKGVMAKGSAMHKAIASYYQIKKQSRKDPSDVDLGQFFKSAFDIEASHVDWDKEDDKPTAIIDRSYGLLKEYRTVIGKKTKPLDIERDVTISFGNVGYDFRVIADLIDKNHFVHEAKVKGRMLSEADIANDFQLSVEAMAHRILYKKAEAGIYMDILLDTKYPKVAQIKAKRTQNDINRALNTIAQVQDAIVKGVFYCVHPSESWTCSEKWCGYYKLHGEFSKLVIKYGGSKAVELLKEKYPRKHSPQDNDARKENGNSA